MLRIKEYADLKGITTQAVYQHINKHENDFKGHVMKRNGVKYLDDEAKIILDSLIRENSVVVLDNSKDEEIKRLQTEINRLRQRNEYLSDRLIEQSDREKEAILKISELGTKLALLEAKKRHWWQKK